MTGQLIDAQTDQGKYVKISLEDWAENLINRALEKHKLSCPMIQADGQHSATIKELENRLQSLEIKLRIVQWLISPMYIGLTGYLVTKITAIL